MRRVVTLSAVLALMVGFVRFVAVGSGAQQRRSTAATLFSHGAPVAHWCNTNGITCVEPYQNWEDFPWFDKVRKEGVRIQEYIGHDEPSVLFYSGTAGS